MAAIPAGEVRNPRRDLPLALLTAIGVVALLYITIQFICIGTLPSLGTSQRPLADASGIFLGSAGGAIISAGVIVSIVGNLNVIVLSGSRLPFAMAERGELPGLIGATHKRFRTPHVSILITSIIVLGLTLGSTFARQVNLSVIARLLSYAVTCAALLLFRRKPGAPPAMFKAPGGVGVAIAALLLTAWLLSNSSLLDARDSAIAAGVGLLIYFAYRVTRKVQPESATSTDQHVPE